MKNAYSAVIRYTFEGKEHAYHSTIACLEGGKVPMSPHEAAFEAFRRFMHHNAANPGITVVIGCEVNEFNLREMVKKYFLPQTFFD